jgi:hypothetical protein
MDIALLRRFNHRIVSLAIFWDKLFVLLEMNSKVIIQFAASAKFKDGVRARIAPAADKQLLQV